MKHERVHPEDTPGRWQIFRQLLVFQYKLLIDAAKDFLLSPLALAAALVDMTRLGPRSQMLFPALMRLGRRAERAINLFGRRPEDDEWTVDRMVDGVETRIRRRYGSPDSPMEQQTGPSKSLTPEGDEP
jgi:hypothetical protein